MDISRRVLLAEDDSLNRSAVVSILEFLGHTVEAVPDGLQALEALGRETYDLVLMDCQMPGIDGFEVTRRLRQRGIRVPVIAFTALRSAMVRSRCQAAGMNDFLAKPCELVQLDAVLRRWLGGVGE